MPPSPVYQRAKVLVSMPASTLLGFISELVMVGVSVTGQPMKPPQLLVLAVVAKEPSNTQPSIMMVLPPPAILATIPPWVPSPLTLLLMLTELRQPVMFNVPDDLPTMPPANLALVAMVPSTWRFLITAFLANRNGAVLSADVL